MIPPTPLVGAPKPTNTRSLKLPFQRAYLPVPPTMSPSPPPAITTVAPSSGYRGGLSVGSIGAPQVPRGPEATWISPCSSIKTMNSLKHSEPPAPNWKFFPQTLIVPSLRWLRGSSASWNVVGKHTPAHQVAKAVVAGGSAVLGWATPCTRSCTFWPGGDAWVAVAPSRQAAAAARSSEPKSGSYPVAGSAGGGSGGPMTGAIRSLM
jgi:hypothetical protein